MVATLAYQPEVAVESRFVWFDLMSTDRAASLRFFRAVLGWEIADDLPGAYTTVRVGDTPIGGIVQLLPGEEHPSHVVAYVGSTDVDELAARAHGLGGAVAYAPVDVPGVGRIALLSDPLGTTVAAMSANPLPAAIDDAPLLGGVVWRELISDAPVRSAAFYARLFDWESDGIAGSSEDYTVLRAGEAAVGGVACPADGTPLGWLHYFLVRDLDDAIACLSANGGSLRGPITVIPHDCRFVLAADPTGAPFALFQSLV